MNLGNVFNFKLITAMTLIHLASSNTLDKPSDDDYSGEVEVRERTEPKEGDDTAGKSADCSGGGMMMGRGGGGGQSQPIIIVTGGSGGGSVPSTPPAEDPPEDSGGGSERRRRRARRRRARLVRMAKKAARNARRSG